MKPNLLSRADLQPVMNAIAGQVDDLANALYHHGRITDLCKDADFYTRLTRLEQQFPSLSVMLHRAGILPPEMYKLWHHPILLGAAKQIIGPNVAAHPNWSLRTKTPNQEQATVPWHQDAAYLDSSADATLQLTAWIPFIDANIHNGCMQVLRGGHRAGRVIDHIGVSGNTWYIETEESKISPTLQMKAEDIEKNIMTCEVPFGGVLFLNNLIPHRSLNNQSDKIRWSIDLRWQDPALSSGFYGIKDLLVVAKENEPSYQPDWETWAKQDRHVMAVDKAKKQKQNTTSTVTQLPQQQPASSSVEDDLFDTTIVGPWMDRWPLTHRNRHTDKWERLKATTSEAERKAQSQTN